MKQNENAVSPVIGVILMVAITVILAAIIATFTLGMANDIDTGKSITVTARQVGDDIVITYFGGQDAGELQSLAITAGESELVTTEEISVGDRFILASGTATRDPVVVVAVFTDGTEQVIYDAYV